VELLKLLELPEEGAGFDGVVSVPIEFGYQRALTGNVAVVFRDMTAWLFQMLWLCP